MSAKNFQTSPVLGFLDISKILSNFEPISIELSRVWHFNTSCQPPVWHLFQLI